MNPSSKARLTRIHTGLFALALVLGGLALVVDTPQHPEEDSSSRASAIDLAQWLRDRRPGLLVVDLRPADQYRDYHLPQARQLADSDVLAMLERADRPELVLLYGAGDGTAHRLARAAAAAGHDGVVYLADGVSEWQTEVLQPTLRRDASEQERVAFERVAALSRYFGGRPRYDVPENEDSATAPPARPRRGCGI